MFNLGKKVTEMIKFDSEKKNLKFNSEKWFRLYNLIDIYIYINIILEARYYIEKVLYNNFFDKFLTI